MPLRDAIDEIGIGEFYIALCVFHLLSLIAFNNQTSLSICSIRRLLEVALFSSKSIYEILHGKLKKPSHQIYGLIVKIE